MKRKHWFVAGAASLLAIGFLLVWLSLGDKAWRSPTGVSGGGVSVAASGTDSAMAVQNDAAARYGTARRAGQETMPAGRSWRAESGDSARRAAGAGLAASAGTGVQGAAGPGEPVALPRGQTKEDLRLSLEQRSLEARRRVLAEQYARFFDVNGLSPEQREQVLAILLREHTSNLKDLRKNLPSEVPIGVLLDARAENREEARAGLAEVLSPDALKLFEEYRASQPRRQLVEDINVVLSGYGQALAPEVVDSVTRILHQHRISPGAAFPDTYVTQEIYNLYTQQDPRVLEVVRQVMTPRQFELFKLSFAARYRVKR